jgi:hypothetical protein
MANLYTIGPFHTDGGQVPALHHLSPMRSNGIIDENDKFAIILKKYPKWNKYLQAINYNGLFSRAWAYLKQQTSGVIQNNGKVFQPCLFATAPFAINLTNILKVVTIGPEDWGQIRTQNVHDDPPPVAQKTWLMQFGLMHRFVAEGKGEILYMAPKDSGNVFIPILSDGTPLYIKMKWLTAT